MAILELTSDHTLAANEWKVLAGTPLIETMIRNRVHFTPSGKPILGEIVAWCKENATAFFHISSSTVYFESKLDQTQFVLIFSGKEVDNTIEKVIWQPTEYYNDLILDKFKSTYGL